MPSGLFWIVLRRSWASFAPASTPFQSGLLPRSCLRCCPSALRAARHRERERIKSDVGLAEQGKRIGRPTISRRLRERIAERIAAARRPLASPRIYPDRRWPPPWHSEFGRSVVPEVGHPFNSMELTVASQNCRVCAYLVTAAPTPCALSGAGRQRKWGGPMQRGIGQKPTP